MPSGTDIAEITAGLTEAQTEAVTYSDGPLLVVAGAGSGKTRVITRRIAYLRAIGVPAENIIAVTFTNKAASEMRRRVEALAGDEVYVTTFHSFCARLLRRHANRIGWESSFTIYDRTDSLRVLRRLVKDMDLDPATYKPRDALEFISVHKDRVTGPGQVEEDAIGIEEQTMAHLYRRYEQKLADNNALDFDDLLLKALHLFSECPGVLARYQHVYRHVLVDEYQDINLPQHLIARALQGKHRNITAVGDPDQMIYSWRGARLQNLLEFEQDFPGTHIVMLERNYRSTANILRCAGHCIRHNVLRHEKELWTEKEAGDPIKVCGFADPFEEGRWVAQRVDELVSAGVAQADIAVFYRTKQQSLPLEHAFATLSIPHQVVDSVGFFDRAVVKDLRAYLQLLVNPRDDEACLRIINTPSRGIGVRTLERLQAAAAEHGWSLIEATRHSDEIDSLGTRASVAAKGFWQLYQRLGEAATDDVRGLVREVLTATDYVDSVRDEDRADVQEVVDMFLGYAAQYDEQNPGGGLVGFLEQAALVSDVDGWNAGAGAVTLMTLHSAKGLEFDVVFIVGAEEDILPHRRALDDHPHETQEAALEEERRLFYVGMTRARKRLYICWSGTRRIVGREEVQRPSRFLDELPADVVDRTDGAPAGLNGGAAGFMQEMQGVLERKRPHRADSTVLRITDESPHLEQGARVAHQRYGEGEVIEVNSLGSRFLVRVNFFEGSPMALVLSPGDIGRA